MKDQKMKSSLVQKIISGLVHCYKQKKKIYKLCILFNYHKYADKQVQ